MKYVTLIVCDNISPNKVKTTQLEYNEFDENGIIELTIGSKRYSFNNNGFLNASTIINSCIDNNQQHHTCAQTLSKITCEPKYNNEQ